MKKYCDHWVASARLMRNVTIHDANVVVDWSEAGVH